LGVWIGFDWQRVGTVGELLCVRCWAFGFLRHGVSYERLGGTYYILRNFSPEGVDSMFLWNTGIILQVHMALQAIRSRPTRTSFI
jgi:hypothetical protein